MYRGDHRTAPGLQTGVHGREATRVPRVGFVAGAGVSYLGTMSPLRVVATFAGFGLACVLALGMIAWNVRPEQLAAPESGVKKASGAVSAVKAPRLPAEKACLPPPTDAAEDEMVASAGLDPDAVRASMRVAAQGVLPCFKGSPTVTMLLSVQVACTGRVSAVTIEDDGGAESLTQACVEAGLKYAAFPAHALPDGDQFEYPLTYNAPG